MKEEIYITSTPAQTEALGAALARRLREEKTRRAFIALYGEMGVGKTAFVRGFCGALGIGAVHSPTYTLVNEYRTGEVPVYHFDLYRIADADDLYTVGYDDYLKKDGYILTEWSENIPDELPEERLDLWIERTDNGDGRRLTLRDRRENGKEENS